jgi:hypothetical protein
VTDSANAAASSAATVGHAATAVVNAARVLCSRSNSRSASILHSVAMQFVSLCSSGDVMWRALDDSAAELMLLNMSRFICDVVALGGRNVELSIARAVALVGHAPACPVRFASR